MNWVSSVAAPSPNIPPLPPQNACWREGRRLAAVRLVAKSWRRLQVEGRSVSEWLLPLVVTRSWTSRASPECCLAFSHGFVRLAGPACHTCWGFTACYNLSGANTAVLPCAAIPLLASRQDAHSPRSNFSLGHELDPTTEFWNSVFLAVLLWELKLPFIFSLFTIPSQILTMTNMDAIVDAVFPFVDHLLCPELC